MTDFFQNGSITTFHNLAYRPLEGIETELSGFSAQRPMSLLLPALYSEFKGEALPNIAKQLAEVPYLSEIVIGLDRADREQYRHALKYFRMLPQQPRILWNDGPRLQAIHRQLESHGLAPMEAGKGRNVWYCLGYILASGKSEVVALHDCDITTYDRQLLARLFYPVANPDFAYEFCKGFYSRVADGKINGRVCRLLVTPLLRTFKKVFGSSDYLDYMDSFRYSLAGEFSLRRDIIAELRIPSDWGLEIGVLSEMHNNHALNRLCQVDIAHNYDHKHQDLSANNDQAGLSKMSIDITKTFFRKLASQGIVFDQNTFNTIKATYLRTALSMVETYHSDAVINGLDFDVHREEQAVELFARNITKAGQSFLARPLDKPVIPSWNRVNDALPDLLAQLYRAVEDDMQEHQD